MYSIINMKYCSVLFLLLCFLFPTYGQETPARDQINALKIAYITKQLSLSSEEAQQFWPVFNAYEAELQELKAQENQLKRRLRQELMSGSEEDLEILADQFITGKKKEYDLALEYHGKVKKVLPIRKVILLYRSEDSFKTKILEEWRKRRAQQMQNRRRNLNRNNE